MKLTTVPWGPQSEKNLQFSKKVICKRCQFQEKVSRWIEGCRHLEELTCVTASPKQSKLIAAREL